MMNHFHFWSSENLELEYVEDKQNVKTLLKSKDHH